MSFEKAGFQLLEIYIDLPKKSGFCCKMQLKLQAWLQRASGWEFGEVANGQRGQVAVQQQLAKTQIGAFNDRSWAARRCQLGWTGFCLNIRRVYYIAIK